MTKGKFPNGLGEAMRKAGVGLTRLGELIGTSKQNVGRWVDGERRLRPEWAKKIAPFLDTTPEALLLLDHGANAPDFEIPMISWVSAGAMEAPEVVQELEDAPKLHMSGLDHDGEWIALRIPPLYDSMDRISPPESVIIVNLKDRRLVSNACYVIADAESGEASYKRYRANPPRWEPVSTNLTHEPIFLDEMEGEPRIIGRVRRTMLDM